ncbi:N-acetylglucosamine-6-phosphate deacetylase [Roseibacterium elongatum DSM 19469]|uniref:N-acetylglucosamine-6-phosphate deacetylase n=1 Tax=Roseicyclus elongatus DSM 19469 TaxID=1294273 RepID=W8SS53_9RHOB|nr:N-acetylglucosamine-6-phosphate deacetylase [Roseibacterium elongatum]AHM05360.1 N-acetylglucosamine-6-phosphate deacetylase [Roseibacterium elongatum DSM 19469]
MICSGIDLLDGAGWRRGMEIEIAGGRIRSIRKGTSQTDAPVICPAPLDLQVNGGAGRMLGDCEAPGDVLEILAGHRRLGTAAILPTLISDDRRRTARVISLTSAAKSADPGILGLHLEGPHLALPGAHDPAMLRDLTDADIDTYLAAKRRLGVLMITLAPERASPQQIARLTGAGIIVALGHSDCDFDTACAALAAGARMVTHLFNAMSGLHHRAPGLVGAALDRAEWFGLIADGHHVHDAALRVALQARFEAAIPVSDAMAVAGTHRRSFVLNGREIRRAKGKLTLADGTLAGADLSLVQGLCHIATCTKRPLTEVMPMGFDRPHRLLFGTPNRLSEGDAARLLRLDGDTLSCLDGQEWRPLPV